MLTSDECWRHGAEPSRKAGFPVDDRLHRQSCTGYLFVKEASRVLASGGLLAFTLERHDGDGFIMGEGRRYAHSASYVRASIEAVGLVVLQLEQQSTRYEKGVPVPSLVIVAEKS